MFLDDFEKLMEQLKAGSGPEDSGRSGNPAGKNGCKQADAGDYGCRPSAGKPAWQEKSRCHSPECACRKPEPGFHLSEYGDEWVLRPFGTGGGWNSDGLDISASVSSGVLSVTARTEKGDLSSGFRRECSTVMKFPLPILSDWRSVSSRVLDDGTLEFYSADLRVKNDRMLEYSVFSGKFGYKENGGRALRNIREPLAKGPYGDGFRKVEVLNEFGRPVSEFQFRTGIYPGSLKEDSEASISAVVKKGVAEVSLDVETCIDADGNPAGTGPYVHITRKISSEIPLECDAGSVRAEKDADGYIVLVADYREEEKPVEDYDLQIPS